MYLGYFLFLSASCLRSASFLASSSAACFKASVRVSAVWPSTRLTNKLEFWLFGPQLDKRLNVRALAVWPSARLTNKLEFWLFGPQLDKQLNVRALAVWPSARLTLMASELWLVGPQFDLKQLASELWLCWPSARLETIGVGALAVWPSARLETINKQLPSLFGGEPKVLLLGLVYYLVNTDLLNKRLVGKNIQLHNQFKIVTRIHLIKQINFVARL